ncbi:pilus assembly protein TadG-related protein [Vibrio sp. 10N.261.55.A7]|uniref:TadE/TadG family type IV pilus assembly protein n=1 Tax=Vibrio sp. 10N.261.55.A7 TaxID=1880851 RepID=UPI000CB7A3E1|nr:pilus assembly protein TadG-related protein [Vibrio sp. 10N.261.55.A7]PMJ92578.1 pilus assembly protein [Vibrio sp. 10N.261.55.A7]
MVVRNGIIRNRGNQSGLVLVMVTVAMAALIGVAALSIDVNHSLMNKTRLQNGVDAAVLAAALVIDNDGTTTEATAVANTTFTNVASATGNAEMDFSSATITVEYSNDPTTFPDAGYTATEDTFVRISVSGYELEEFFVQMFGMSKEISASAVAGPSPPEPLLANIVPIAVCEGDDTGTNGYDEGEVYALKLADQNQSEMGAGNFQLLDFGSGANTVRDALAGGFDETININDPVTTKPGNSVGPVGQGLNTRFDQYSGGGVSSTDHPSDVYIRQPVNPATMDNAGVITYDDTSGDSGQPWGYTDYEAALPDCSGDADCRIDQGGQVGRRILPIPVVDCSTASGGTTSFNIEAIGCFFLLQEAPTSNGSKQPVFGEFIEDCTVTGGVPGQGDDTDGPYKIVLYKDPLSTES